MINAKTILQVKVYVEPTTSSRNNRLIGAGVSFQATSISADGWLMTTQGDYVNVMKNGIVAITYTVVDAPPPPPTPPDPVIYPDFMLDLSFSADTEMTVKYTDPNGIVSVLGKFPNGTITVSASNPTLKLA